MPASLYDFESCSDPVGVISTVSFPKIPSGLDFRVLNIGLFE